MNPCVLFLNGPECQAKLQLLQTIKSHFNEDVCIYINRKEILKMFNAHSELNEESFEWVLQKVLKNILNNGVYVLFDVFLPTRRMNQYALQLKGLPCYWLGVFIKDISEDFSKDFYDYSIVIDPEGNDFSEQSREIFNHISKKDPACFVANKIVEKKPRKRLIPARDDLNSSSSSQEDSEKFSYVNGKSVSENNVMSDQSFNRDGLSHKHSNCKAKNSFYDEKNLLLEKSGGFGRVKEESGEGRSFARDRKSGGFVTRAKEGRDCSSFSRDRKSGEFGRAKAENRQGRVSARGRRPGGFGRPKPESKERASSYIDRKPGGFGRVKTESREGRSFARDRKSGGFVTRAKEGRDCSSFSRDRKSGEFGRAKAENRQGRVSARGRRLGGFGRPRLEAKERASSYRDRKPGGFGTARGVRRERRSSARDGKAG